MQSTGEVACFGPNQHEAYLKAWISCGNKLPHKNILITVGSERRKAEVISAVRSFIEMGFQIYATKGTFEYFKSEGVDNIIMVYKPLVRREPNALTIIQRNTVDLVINVPDSMDSHGVTDGFYIRRSACDNGTPIITDVSQAVIFAQSLYRKWERERQGKEFWSIESWQGYQDCRRQGS